LHHSLAIDDAARIEFRHAGDRFRARLLVKVNYFLGCVLERWDASQRDSPCGPCISVRMGICNVSTHAG
jgi:hypothetical protein